MLIFWLEIVHTGVDVQGFAKLAIQVVVAADPTVIVLALSFPNTVGDVPHEVSVGTGPEKYTCPK